MLLFFSVFVVFCFFEFVFFGRFFFRSVFN